MPHPPYSSSSPSELVAAALGGDQRAWDAIIGRYRRLVWKAVNMMLSDDDDRQEAFARTWGRLFESMGTIRDPERLAGWLRITAVREAIAVGRARSVLVLVDDDRILDDANGDTPRSLRWEPEEQLLGAEQSAAIRQAFHKLDDRCRELLTLLIVQDTPLSYAEVEDRLQRSHGWIGPTRARCLDRLWNAPEMQALFAATGPEGN
ncbi:MAG: sigma-70 family RNA polymerase sigma factor [Acidimicrobiales bacterium]